MAQPTPYERSNSFVPVVNGEDIEIELDAIEVTLDETLENLELIQRDDGRLANGAVHPDALSAATLALMASDWVPRGQWITATLYSIGDVVENVGQAYVCSTEHTSAGAFATDDASGYWVDFGEVSLRPDLASTSDVAKGDALVGGKRTLANAVAFTLHQYHENRGLNLKTDCGATGDGTTDDTAAIQRAADIMAGGGDIFVPAGTYKHSDDIYISPFQKWHGEGKFVTRFAPTVAVTSGFVYLAPSLETGGIIFEDIGFSGNATTLRAIHLANLTLCVLRNIHTEGYSNAAAKPILWNNVESSLIDSPSLFNVTAGGGIYLTGDANNNTIISPTITAAANGNGIIIEAGIYNTTIINPNLEGASLGNIGITCNGTINTRIETGFMEYWTGACVAANSGSAKNLAIRGVHLHATSAASQMVALNSAGTNDGVVVEDCWLALLGNGGTTTVGIDVGASTGVRVRGNKSGGTGTGIVKVNGVVQTLPDYESSTGTQTLSSNDAGASEGPELNLDRQSASPAASDALGVLSFKGRDSGGNSTVFGKIRALITDPTNGSEDGLLELWAMVAGTLTKAFSFGQGLFSSGLSDPGAGKINAADVQINGQSLGWTYAAQTATTSGTTVELSAAIPSTATEIEIILSAVSTGTNAQPPLVQLGDSGGYETAGYVSDTSLILDAGANETAITDGFSCARATNYVATDLVTGVLRLVRWDTAEHLWVATGQFMCEGISMNVVVGTKTTSAAMDRIRLTTTGGAATFDAGEARLRYR